MAKAERWLVTSGQDVLATKGIAALLGKGEAP
jgi:hypothetical protein